MLAHPPQPDRAALRLAAAAACLAAWGCAPATEPVGRPCYPLAVAIADAGADADAAAAPPRITCTADRQCPPPLVCTAPEEPEDVDGPATCAIDPFGSEPDLLVEVFDRARLPLDLIELPGDDGLLVQWKAPREARQIRCLVTGCPWTEELARGGFARCPIVDVLRDVDLGDRITITPRIQSRPAELDPRATLNTCAAGDVDLRYTATELNLACWAYSDTDLVAVSSIHRVDPAQLGRHRDRVLSTDCALGPPATGAACVVGGAGPALGVCVGPRCCTPCSKDAHCGGPGSACRPLPAQGRSGSDPLPGPYLGYCADTCAAAGVDGGAPDAGAPDGGVEEGP